MSQLETKMPLCEVCRKNVSVGVASVPGIPYSAAYCKECLEADAHPMHILVSGTALNGGLSKSAAWWREMVEHTVKHLGGSLDDFNARVAQEIKELEELERRAGPDLQGQCD